MATADDIFNAIKAHELDFPLPKLRATIHVGTFDPARGVFKGYVSHFSREASGIEPDPDFPRRRPITIPVRTPPTALADGALVTLEFHSKVPGVTVTIGDQTVNSDGTTVSIDVGAATDVEWSISSGGKEHRDSLQISRAPIIGLGGLVVPILPVAIVYEPPPDASKKNQASYQTTHGVSTSIKLSVTNGETTSDDGDLLSVSSFGSLLTSIAGVLRNFQQATDGGPGATTPATQPATQPASPSGPGKEIPWLAAVASAVQLVGSLIGSTTTTKSSDQQTVRNNTLTLKKIVGDTLTTGAAAGGNAGGPGVGDQFYVLRDARVLWLAYGGQLTLTLLDYAREATIGVAPLKAGGATIGIDAAMASALLDLDPFVAGGSSFLPPSGRFERVKTCEVDQAPGKHDFSLTQIVDRDTSTTLTKTTVETKQEREGWLGFLGIGPSANKTTKVTISTQRTDDIDVTDTQVATLSLLSTATEPPYAVDVYQDTVFGTFAFRVATLLSTPSVSGVVLGADAMPRSGVEVTARAGDRVFATHSGAGGRFEFRSPDIGAGAIEIEAGAASVTVRFDAGKALSGIEIISR